MAEDKYKPMPDARWLVVGPMCWGKGLTVKAARKNAKAYWPRVYCPKWTERIFKCNSLTWVDADGVVHGYAVAHE